MSSNLTSICDSNHSDSPPYILYGPGVFHNLRKLSEESMALIKIYEINKTYHGFKPVRGPRGANSATLAKETPLRPTIISQKIPEDYGAASRRVKAPVDEPPTSDATSGHSNLTGSRMRGVQQWTNTSSSWANTGGTINPQGNPNGGVPEVVILATRKDGRLGKL
ncbi:hypothetical protein O181_122198 [Austropuccinia psidii MF-1]|uniref:Uncharacterized protein n=1 Tax=Austropuccinia psidii MF-1 TaxID=1389203 RepID=A0A9Q3Q1Z3_9BASI|nr:hypothetical protein [Austropuccinia psidii MF-1]